MRKRQKNIRVAPDEAAANKQVADRLGIPESELYRLGAKILREQAEVQARADDQQQVRRQVVGLSAPEPDSPAEHRAAQIAESAAPAVAPGTDERDETQRWLTPLAERRRAGKYTYYSPRPGRQPSYGQRKVAGFLSFGQRPKADTSWHLPPPSFHPVNERT